jgi:sugar phosphate isomerase/epimerase
MTLSLSNFAWDQNNSDDVFKKLNELGIRNVETILTKITDWDNLDEQSLLNYLNILKKYNLNSSSIQSLFYNTDCKTISNVNCIIKHFKNLIYYAKILSTNILVFGSPSLRKKNDGWEESLITIFKTVDKLLLGTNLEITIEPNSKIYGGEFFISIPEIVSFIKKNNLINIKTMIDTHNLIGEGMDPFNELENYFEYINHIHISENKLEKIKNNQFHRLFSKKIKSMGYNKIITYEVIKCDDILSSIELYNTIYGN